MASVDPALLARAKAEIEAHPAFQAYVQGRGRAQGGGAIDPRVFGVTYLPPEYKYSLGSRSLVDELDWADTALPLAGAGVLGLAGGLMATGAPAAGGAGTAGTTAGAGGTTTGIASGAAPAAGALPSSSLPAAGFMGGPSAVASQGVSAGVPMAAGAGGGGFLSNIWQGIKDDPFGTIGNVGGVLGGAAQGAAQGRRDDAYAAATAGRVNLDALALDQRRAALRSLLGGVQDASIGRPAGSTIPTFQVNGGLRPSALSNREALMTELSRPAPTVEPPVAGTGEKVLGGAGLITGILGALGRRQPSMNAGGR